MATIIGNWPVRTMDTRSRRIVSGFIRQSFSFQGSGVPDNIYHVCLVFYYSVQDSFSEWGEAIASPQLAKLSEWQEFGKDFTRIINAGNTAWYNTAYGTQSIDPFVYRIHKWTLRVHRSNGDSFVGIDSLWSNTKHALNSTFVSASYAQQFYAVSSSGYKFSHYAHGKVKSDIEYETGDKLALIFDCSRDYASLSLSVNGGQYESIFHLIHKSKWNPNYRLAVCLPGGSYFELINYAYSEKGSLLDLYAE